MPGRYIPPALRKQTLAAEVATKSSTKHNEDDGDSTLPSRSLADLSLKSSNNLLTPHDIHHHFWPNDDYSSTNRSTLNDAASNPGQLAYIMLFWQANPRWESDHIIFAKSNLNFLPHVDAVSDEEPAAFAGQEEQADTTDAAEAGTVSSVDDSVKVDIAEAKQSATGTKETSAENQDSSKPLAVFAQTRRGLPRSHKFLGWYTLSRVSRLAPHSPDIVRMLEQKWTLEDARGAKQFRTRDQKGWAESLAHEWAVLKMEQCDGPVMEVEHVENAKLDRKGKLVGETPIAEPGDAVKAEEVESK